MSFVLFYDFYNKGSFLLRWKPNKRLFLKRFFLCKKKSNLLSHNPPLLHLRFIISSLSFDVVIIGLFQSDWESTEVPGLFPARPFPAGSLLLLEWDSSAKAVKEFARDFLKANLFKKLNEVWQCKRIRVLTYLVQPCLFVNRSSSLCKI